MNQLSCQLTCCILQSSFVNESPLQWNFKFSHCCQFISLSHPVKSWRSSTSSVGASRGTFRGTFLWQFLVDFLLLKQVKKIRLNFWRKLKKILRFSGISNLLIVIQIFFSRIFSISFLGIPEDVHPNICQGFNYPLHRILQSVFAIISPSIFFSSSCRSSIKNFSKFI